jgi:hypothetical protein
LVPFQFIQQAAFSDASRAGNIRDQPDLRVVLGPVKVQAIKAEFFLPA